MTEPTWTIDGEPANIEAALADTLAWLVLLRPLVEQMATRHREEALARLDRCIAATKHYLPAEIVEVVE